MMNISPDPSYLPGLPKHVSFVDEAGHAKDPNQKYLCLAGLLATESAWKQFDSEWRTVCAAEGLKEPFHMKDLAARRKEFAGWEEERRRRLLGELVSVTEHAGAIPIGSVVSIDGFSSLAPEIRRGFKDPHFLAFQSLTYQIAVAGSMQWEPGQSQWSTLIIQSIQADLATRDNCGRQSASTTRSLHCSWNRTVAASRRNILDFRLLISGRMSSVIISRLFDPWGKIRVGHSCSL
jgi:hypothetical protein